MTASDFNIQPRLEPWPVGANGWVDCPVCGEPWRPFAFSYLPCHALCLFTEEIMDSIRYDESSSDAKLSSYYGVSVGTIRAIRSPTTPRTRFG